jgi:hypothetical protein
MHFRRVSDARAGATALGILVPPGLRTRVILRPRGLPWDLLPAQPAQGDPSRLLFSDFGREEAAGVARKVPTALEQAALAGRHPLEIVPRPNANGFEVWANVAELCWIVCTRVPGQSYQPSVFSVGEEAHNALRSLAGTLFPPANAAQEYYFNTQNFAGERR